MEQEQTNRRLRLTKVDLTRAEWVVLASTVVLAVIAYSVAYKVTLWNWLDLLVVPVVIAGGGIWFNRQQKAREEELTERRAQDDAVQAYLDHMSKLLTDKDKLLTEARPEDALSMAARARTLATLSRLDGSRKGTIVRFLSESGLLNKDKPVVRLGGIRKQNIKADYPDMEDSKIPPLHTKLGQFRLTAGSVGMHETNVKGADLRGIDLSHVDLRYANLQVADLKGANLSGSLLLGADLMGADLRGASLSDVILQWADLWNARLTEEQLAALAANRNNSLKGAVMPDGSRPYQVPPENESFLRTLQGDPDARAILQRERVLQQRISTYEALKNNLGFGP